MGLRPGESDCSRCLFRPKADGGNGLCPFQNTLYRIYSPKPVADCPRFREGDYVPKAVRKLKQEEALF